MLAGSEFWKIEMGFSLMTGSIFSALTAMDLAIGVTMLECLDLVVEVGEIKDIIDGNSVLC